MPENQPVRILSAEGASSDRGTDHGGAVLVDTAMVGGHEMSEAATLLSAATSNMLWALQEAKLQPRYRSPVEIAVISAEAAWHYGKTVLGYGPGPVSNHEEASMAAEDNERRKGSYVLLSLRDYFAARALVGFTAHLQLDADDGPIWNANGVALRAYELADAMLRAREGRKS